MENLSPDQQSALNNILNNAGGGSGGASLIPQSLVTAMTVGFIVINVVSVLFLIVYIAGIIRKWKVQSAIFHMQKDLAEIKAQLVKPAAPVAPQTPPQPGESPRMIAADEPSSPSPTA